MFLSEDVEYKRAFQCDIYNYENNNFKYTNCPVSTIGQAWEVQLE